MKKTVLSCVAILSLCVAAPAMADVDDTFMDWSYASGLDPKPRPTTTETQKRTTGFAETQTISDTDTLDADIFATSEINQTANTQENFNSSEYANWSYTTTQNSSKGTASFDMNMGQTAETQTWGNGGYTNGYNEGNTSSNTANVYSQNIQTGQVSANPQYYQVPIQAIQTPAEIHRVNNPVKVNYPVTKQYPISMQYPVTIQKEITVQRPVVVQQPIVVQRPIVMQQPVMVQHQPLMVQNKPVMVQQQPTIVQKQPIVVNAPAPTVMPTMPTPVMHMSGITSQMMPTMQQPAQKPCPMMGYTAQMPQQTPQMGYGTAPAAQMVQIPMQVNGTLTGTFVPSAGCNGGCVK